MKNALGSTDARLQKYTLQNLREFLQTEDDRVQKLQEQARDQSRESDDEEDEDGNKNQWLQRHTEVGDYIPSMIDLYERPVHKLCLSTDASIRLNAILFITVYLSQGWTNPREAIPYIIGLLPDRDPRVRLASLRCVQRLCSKEKFLSDLEQRYLDGVKLSFHLLTQLYRNGFDPLNRHHVTVGPNSAGPRRQEYALNFEGFHFLYGQLRRARNDLVQTFINRLMKIDGIGSLADDKHVSSSTCAVLGKVFDGWRKEKEKKGDSVWFTDRLELLAYSATVIASLPFDDDEPLKLMTLISRIVAKVGASLQSSMAKTLRQIKRVSGEKIPGFEESDSEDGGSNDPKLSVLLETLTKQCQAAMAVCVLIYLNANLTTNYALGEKKYENWQYHRSKAQNPVRCPKVAEAVLDFSQFPMADAVPRPKRQKRGKKAKQPSVIPEALLQQQSFFMGLMNDPDKLLLLQNVHKKRKKPKPKTKAEKPEKKKQAKKKAKSKAKAKKKGGSSLDDLDSPDDDDYTEKSKKGRGKAKKQPTRRNPGRKAANQRRGTKGKRGKQKGAATKYKDHMSSDEAMDSDSD